jgi:hypothetical protein
MIRGSIEVVTPELVQGWIHCVDGVSRDKVVLAFAGRDCVGSGKIGVFRSDLAEAGLGDGYLGFSFPITADPARVGSITIKLDGSDAVLLQGDAEVVSKSPDPRILDEVIIAKQLAALKWQLNHARINQADFDYLRILWSFGVYERSLLRRDGVGKVPMTDTGAAIAKNLLESYIGGDADLSMTQGVTAKTFADELVRISRDLRLAPVVALSSKDKITIRALEGSHIRETPGSPESARRGQYVDFIVSPENIVILDSRVSAELYASAGQSLDIILASPTFI